VPLPSLFFFKDEKESKNPLPGRARRLCLCRPAKNSAGTATPSGGMMQAFYHTALGGLLRRIFGYCPPQARAKARSFI